MDESEYNALKRRAKRERSSVGAWVRNTISKALHKSDVRSTESKLETIRKAAGHEGPTGDIEQILAEIEQGYL